MAVAAALAIGAAIALEGGPANKRQDLADRIEGAVSITPLGETVAIATLVPITFDFVGVLTPYTDNRAAATVLGIEWDAEARVVYRSEGWIELVFVSNGQVVAWCHVARGRVDFPSPQGPFALDAPAPFQVLAADAPLSKALVPIGPRHVTFADTE